MIRQTTAALLVAHNQPLQLVRLAVPPLAVGQVLVKMAFSGICHSQLMEVTGQRGPDPYLPHLLGHEGSGEVLAVGPGVTKVVPGNKVVLGWIQGAGLNAPGAEYQLNGQRVSSGSVTTFTEYAIVAENRCTCLPAEFPLNLAPLLGCAVPTGAGLVLNTVKPKDNSTIAFFGLGGIGVSALLALPSFACERVIAVDVEPEKLALASRLGATDVIDASCQHPIHAINQLTHGCGVDYSVEAAGLVQTIEQAFAVLNPTRGLCVFASHPAHGEKIQLDPLELLKGKQLIGSNGGACQPDRDIPRFIELYHAGKLNLEFLVSKTYALAQINEAFADLAARRVVRAMIDFSL